MMIAKLTSSDAIVKKIRRCINTDNEDSQHQISPRVYNHWKDIRGEPLSLCR